VRGGVQRERRGSRPLVEDACERPARDRTRPGKHPRRDPCFDDRHRRQRGAEALGHELEIEQPGASATRGEVDAHAGPTERAHRGPEVAIEPSPRLGVAHEQRRTLLRKEGAERLDQVFLLVGQREIHYGVSARWA
jgi:hypothetical protein